MLVSTCSARPFVGDHLSVFDASAFLWSGRLKSILIFWILFVCDFQHRVEESNLWTSSFHVWFVFHHVAADPACGLHFFHDVALFW